MPRPFLIIRPIRLHITLPEDLLGRLNLHLWSDLEQRVPYGASSAFIETAIRQALDRAGAK